MANVDIAIVNVVTAARDAERVPARLGSPE